MAIVVVACGRREAEANLAIQKAELEAEQVRDSIKLVEAYRNGTSEEQAAARATYVAKYPGAPVPAAPVPETAANETNGGTYATRAATTAAEPAAEPVRKKMSNKAKGVLIGTGVGIITGAAVSKKDRAKGAVIGGVIGAGVGLGTGAVLDQRKKEQEEGGE